MGWQRSRFERAHERSLNVGQRTRQKISRQVISKRKADVTGKKKIDFPRCKILALGKRKRGFILLALVARCPSDRKTFQPLWHRRAARSARHDCGSRRRKLCLLAHRSLSLIALARETIRVTLFPFQRTYSVPFTPYFAFLPSLPHRHTNGEARCFVSQSVRGCAGFPTTHQSARSPDVRIITQV